MKSSAVSGLVLLAVACGTNKPDASAPQSPTTSSSVQPTAATATATVATDTPRQKSARELAKVVDGPDAEPVRGRLAAVGISENGFGFSKEERKTFEALGSPSVDANQCGMMISALLDQTSKSLVEKRCGAMDALVKKVNKTSKDKMVSELAVACKITAEESKGASHPWALLLSVIVSDKLAADPESNADEKIVAKHLTRVCER